LAAGMPLSAKKATSVQPSLALGGEPEASPRAFSNGWPSDGGQEGLESTSSTSSPTEPSRQASRYDESQAKAAFASRSGAKRWLIYTLAKSGMTLEATPA